MKGNATLRDFWFDVVDKHTPNFRRRSELGEIFEEYSVSNVLTNPLDDAVLTEGKITFKFNEQNSKHSDMFKVLVFDTTFTTIVDQSPILNDAFMWTSNIDFMTGDYHWVTLNNSVLDVGIDFKKSYWSGSYEFSVVPIPEPGTIFLLITGLMFFVPVGISRTITALRRGSQIEWG